MQIVVLDGYTLNPGDNPWDDLARLGDTGCASTARRPNTSSRRAADADIVLTNKTVLGAAVIAALPRLRFIAVLATGYDVVDIGAASRRGVPVSNVPEYSSAAVVQHTIALLLELCQRVGDHARAVAAGDWTRSPDFCFWLAPPRELSGLTLGIVGLRTHRTARRRRCAGARHARDRRGRDRRRRMVAFHAARFRSCSASPM